MKKLSLFIAFAMLVALTMVSCNNKPKEPTQEEVQEMKQALADSVLAKIDEIAAQNIAFSKDKFSFGSRVLTDKEKAYATVESAKQHFTANKDKYIGMRNALLQ